MQVLNFIKAKELIDNFLILKKSMDTNKEDFLKKIINRIKELEEKINEIHGFKKWRLKEINIHKLKRKIKRAHQISQTFGHELLLDLQNEMARYYKEEIKNTSSNHYLELLNQIMKCCLGVINNPNSLCLSNNNELVEKFFEENILFDYCLAAGGYFFPSSQKFDPLIGSIKHNEKMKYVEDKGNCYGHVMSWAKQIAQDGKISFVNISNNNTQDYQFNQKVPLSSSLYPINKKLKNILSKLDHEHIYVIEIFRYHIGHSLGFRRLSHSGGIEFFDPNYGLFIFSNDEIFKDFFSLLISLYIKNNFHFLSIGYSSIGVQKVTAQENFSILENKFVNPMEKYTSKEAYIELFKEWDGFYQRKTFLNSITGQHLSLDKLKELFFNEMRVRLKYTTDISVLEHLVFLFSLDNESLDQPENEAYAFIKNLKNNSLLVQMNFWKDSNQSSFINIAKSMIYERIDALQNMIHGPSVNEAHQKSRFSEL